MIKKLTQLLNFSASDKMLSRIISLTYFSITLFALLIYKSNATAQEIDFGSYSSKYTVTVTELNPAEDLNFGLLITNEGASFIPVTEAKVLAIEGVKYLDVIVEITADNALLLNGDLNCIGDVSCSLPFTLEAAYANRGVNDVNQATIMNVVSNIASAQFPIMYRGNLPPGPPPAPVYEGYNPALYHETAYLYLYGSVNVGNVDTGTYSANINITINYD